MICSYFEKLYDEYSKEKVLVEKTISDLQVQLRENMKFIKLLEKDVNVSYESFSPRKNDKDKNEIYELKEAQSHILTKIEEAKIKQTEIQASLNEVTVLLKEAKQKEKQIQKLEEKKTEIDDEVFRITLLETQEKERQRISRELHDSTVQNLTSMVHKTELCSKLLDMDPIRCKLELTMMARHLRDIINDTRQMIYDLRPMSFDDMGLELTVERTLDKIKNEKCCNINFCVEGNSYEIKPVIGITILRIIQEACNNALKYSNCSVISVKMIYEEDDLLIVIEDDGKGFDVEHLDVMKRNDNSGFGLSMMRERVYLLSGKIDIISKENGGTKIIVRVPVCKEEKECR